MFTRSLELRGLDLKIWGIRDRRLEQDLLGGPWELVPPVPQDSPARLWWRKLVGAQGGGRAWGGWRHA